MRWQGRGPRGQRALDVEGGRRRATADRRIRVLLLLTTAVCYGIRETNALPFHTTVSLAEEKEERTTSRAERGGGISTTLSPVVFKAGAMGMVGLKL